MRKLHAVTIALTLGVFLTGISLADDKNPREKLRGTLPDGYGKLGMTDLQKQEAYRIQADYRGRIKALEAQIAKLKTDELAAIDKLLTPAQRQLKEFIKGEQAKKANKK